MPVTALIVDDSAFMRMTLIAQLKVIGVGEFVEAEDGDTAITVYKLVKPSFVTMDIAMPGLDGIESLTRIRAFDPKAKIIVISALGNPEKVVQSFNQGAIDFIVKPYKPERLVDSIQKLLKQP